MPEALAKETDLSTGPWSVSALRDYFLTLINSNEKRQTAIQDAHNHDIQAVRDMVGALDVRYEQRFKSQEVAIERGHSTALQLAETKEKGIYSTITAHVETAKGLALKLEVLGTAREEVMREAILAVRRKAEMIEKQADQNAQVLRDLPVALDFKYLSAKMVDEKAATLHAAIVAVDQRAIQAMAALRETISLSLANADKAVTKAEEAATKKFDSVNEFRATLGDQQRTLMPRLEVEVIVKNMNEKIEAQNSYIKSQNDRIIVLAASREGNTNGMHTGWTAAAAVVGWLFALFALFSKFGK